MHRAYPLIQGQNGPTPDICILQSCALHKVALPRRNLYDDATCHLRLAETALLSFKAQTWWNQPSVSLGSFEAQPPKPPRVVYSIGITSWAHVSHYWVLRPKLGVTTSSHLASLVPWSRPSARPSPLLAHQHEPAWSSPTTVPVLHTCTPQAYNTQLVLWLVQDSHQSTTHVDNHSSLTWTTRDKSILCSQQSMSLVC
jgi:hypothetical protein